MLATQAEAEIVRNPNPLVLPWSTTVCRRRATWTSDTSAPLW